VICLAVSSLALAGLRWSGATTAKPAAGLRVVVLDVGQGDAILLDPADGEPVLVDGGPPGGDLRGQLKDERVSGVAAAIVTHDESDHAGGIEELLGRFPVQRLLYGSRHPDLIRDARSAGVAAMPIAQGSEVDSGSLRIKALWPPPALLEGPTPDDLNQAALVLLARWRHFAMLLAADAEAESVPIDPGRIEVLKVAHHGSDDPGLGPLLDRTRPRLAVISVGEHNPYGHPSGSTLATLAEHGVPTLRTDERGDVTIEVGRRGWRVEAEGG
jgi:competence protein ComEC